MTTYGIFIGRFQPFHTAHLETVKFALARVNKLIIIIGSSNQARTVKNPWTSAERKLMILSCLTAEERDRVEFIEARDYLYNDNLWITAIQEKVASIVDEEDEWEVYLFGHKKDRSSFYLRLFPQWEFVETNIELPIDATKIRNLMFRQDKIGIKHDLPAPVYDIVYKFMDSSEFNGLHDDFHYLVDYHAKHSWQGVPYSPTFTTSDAVVIGMGHVLVIRRGRYGKGTIAVPGGFLQEDKSLLGSALEELHEETGMSRDIIKTFQATTHEEHVFDHPNRSLRGRIITHAFCFNLDKNPFIKTLPRVKGNDDADKAWWMPLREVGQREDEFFEDHYHILNYFISKF